MAIDPATAKALAQVAAKILTDKETRSKVLYILLGAVAGGLVIILMPLYILTHPFEMLKAAFAGTPDDAAFIEQYKQENDDKVLVIGDGLVFQDAYPLPVKEASITSGYGQRTDPITGAESHHSGTDFSGTWRSEIYAVADGEVVFVCTDKNDGYGNHLIIRHTGQRTNETGGVETETFFALYGHLNEIYLFKGQSIKQGAVVGLMGGDPERDSNPGRSTGTHLHFEIRTTQDGAGIDPAGYIFPQEQPEESETTSSSTSASTESEGTTSE